MSSGNSAGLFVSVGELCGPETQFHKIALRPPEGFAACFPLWGFPWGYLSGRLAQHWLFLHPSEVFLDQQNKIRCGSHVLKAQGCFCRKLLSSATNSTLPWRESALLWPAPGSILSPESCQLLPAQSTPGQGLNHIISRHSVTDRWMKGCPARIWTMKNLRGFCLAAKA